MKKRSLYTWLTLIMSPAVGWPNTGLANEITPATNQTTITEAALVSAKAERFETALASLAEIEASSGQSYQFKFAKARVLTWAQRYADAQLYYDWLLLNYPTDPDIQVSYGYFEFFKGNLTGAKAEFQAVLERYPDYEDAETGLKRIAKLVNAEE